MTCAGAASRLAVDTAHTKFWPSGLAGGNLSQHGGRSWHQPSQLQPNQLLHGLLGTTGTWVSSNGAGWTRATTASSAFGHSSCASASFCMALLGTGSYSRWNGATWTSRASTTDCLGLFYVRLSKVGPGEYYSCTDGYGQHSLSCARPTTRRRERGRQGCDVQWKTWTTAQPLPISPLYAISCPDSDVLHGDCKRPGSLHDSFRHLVQTADSDLGGALMDDILLGR